MNEIGLVGDETGARHKRQQVQKEDKGEEDRTAGHFIIGDGGRGGRGDGRSNPKDHVFKFHKHKMQKIFYFTGLLSHARLLNYPVSNRDTLIIDSTHFHFISFI